MNPFAHYINTPEFSFSSVSSGNLFNPVVNSSASHGPPSQTSQPDFVAKDKGKQKRPSAVSSGAVADDSSRAVAVSDVQLVSEGGAAAGAARGKGMQSKLKSAFPAAVAATPEPIPKKCGAILTTITGSKRAQKLNHSAFDGVHVDEVALQLQQSDVFACDQLRKGNASSKPREAAQIGSSFEGLHDNCRDTALGLFMISFIHFF